MKSGGTDLYATPELGVKVAKYAEEHSTALPKFITDYHARSQTTRDDSIMLSSNFQSQMHVFLAKTIGAKRVLEIGVYVGYSAMVWSHAVGPDGLVTGLEFSPELVQISKDAFASRDIKNIELITGPAAETLPKLTPSSSYDLVFIDADKPAYGTYLTQLLSASKPGSANRLLRPGALIIADNVLRHGHVADPTLAPTADAPNQGFEEHMNAVRAFNDQCAAERRLETFMFPLWDGVSVLRLLD